MLRFSNYHLLNCCRFLCHPEAKPRDLQFAGLSWKREGLYSNKFVIPTGGSPAHRSDLILFSRALRKAISQMGKKLFTKGTASAVP
jgi:hypothetical protein